MPAPRRDRPPIPTEYGVRRAKAFVEWSHVEDRLTKDPVYWVAAVTRRGSGPATDAAASLC
jgi:hypothetical protein